MKKKINAALISVYYKDGLESIIHLLHEAGVRIYSTGGTQQFIEGLKVPCIPVESLTGYPSILGGRVKTLHPIVFGGILGKREEATHVTEMEQYHIPEIDLVIVDLYPFEETVRCTTDEQQIIEKIDIGGPSMIRAAAKNFSSVVVVAAKRDYPLLEKILGEQRAETTLEQRKAFAVTAFDICTEYDTAISNYFNHTCFASPFGKDKKQLRYGENPHQQGVFFGDTSEIFEQLNGKELSYNNLVDIDAAVELSREFGQVSFAIIKHTNVCGAAQRNTVKESWEAALAGDPESAFGGVVITNGVIDEVTARAINEIFFEVLIAPAFDEEALTILRSKKNRILLQLKSTPEQRVQFRSVLNGVLMQDADQNDLTEWKEAGGRHSGFGNPGEKEDLVFANIICKHLKSNAIALVKNRQLLGKGCGQTSRIDALRQSIEKAKQFQFSLEGAALASDAFFPFDDCVQIAHAAGISAFIQPGGSVRDKDSIDYCITHKLAMIITGVRHFKH